MLSFILSSIFDTVHDPVHDPAHDPAHDPDPAFSTDVYEFFNEKVLRNPSPIK